MPTRSDDQPSHRRSVVPPRPMPDLYAQVEALIQEAGERQAVQAAARGTITHALNGISATVREIERRSHPC